MSAGGNTEDAYTMLKVMEKNQCEKCDAGKADCNNSMYPGQGDCWAAEAYQKCGNARQAAYDAVNQLGGNTPLAYCFLQVLDATDTKSTIQDKMQLKEACVQPWDCSNSMYPGQSDCWAAEAYQKCYGNSGGNGLKMPS